MDCIELCAAVLQWHCTVNSTPALSSLGPQKTSFHSCRVPPISVSDYVARIYRYSKCSPECCVIALVYMDRFLAATATPLTLYNVHRMVLISIMIAAKLRDDIYFSNGYYGSIGGIPRDEINRLETTFLTTCNWALWVEPLNYWEYLEQSALKVRSHSIGPTAGPMTLQPLSSTPNGKHQSNNFGAQGEQPTLDDDGK